MDLSEVEYDNIDWITLAQDRDKWRAYVSGLLDVESAVSCRRTWTPWVCGHSLLVVALRTVGSQRSDTWDRD
ncbi:hypothetical protein ANN_25762 [Periplaneta americana]|uniref:Uncharacterized protein n=1 Tax=Periplaneta americana TaxID=6978 RepID=A0ABQ8S431_PERAM|nr:hypothetical protein ANN_25762 [Periplaneta americana]